MGNSKGKLVSFDEQEFKSPPVSPLSHSSLPPVSPVSPLSSKQIETKFLLSGMNYDPRSPMNNRTPIVNNKENCSLLDPRSPTPNVQRTPLKEIEYNNKKIGYKQRKRVVLADIGNKFTSYSQKTF